MGWLLAIAGALYLWMVWRASRIIPVPAPGDDDPYAGEVARFRRAVHDWCRG